MRYMLQHAADRKGEMMDRRNCLKEMNVNILKTEGGSFEDLQSLENHKWRKNRNSSGQAFI